MPLLSGRTVLPNTITIKCYPTLNLTHRPKGNVKNIYLYVKQRRSDSKARNAESEDEDQNAEYAMVSGGSEIVCCCGSSAI